MKKLILILLSFSLSACFSQGIPVIPVASTIPNALVYALPADEAHVTVCVYTTGGVLVRTLISNDNEKKGTHTVVWDGLDNDGVPQTSGTSFVLKTGYNNDTFTWMGIVGNTSDSLSGKTVWRGESQQSGMALTGSTMRVAMGFSEAQAAQSLFNTSHPQQQSVYSAQKTATGQSTYFVCSSNLYTFWGGCDYVRAKFFVFGERLSNNSEIHFSAGNTFVPSNGRTYSGVVDLNTAAITGMACQKAGNGYLYVSHASLNQIDVFKTSDSTGTLVQTISITNPNSLAIENDNAIWITQGTTVTKYSINTSTGSLTITGSHITGFANIIGEDFAGGVLAIEDAGSQQVVKLYNSTTLAPTITIGTTGGYISDPTVTNTKFYLNDLRGTLYSFVAHDGSGGWWIGDSGNQRSQHFNSSGTFIESIQYVSTYTMENTGVNNAVTYDVQVCSNQNTAFFIDFKEYALDYTKGINAGFWTLAYNWGYNLTPGWHNTRTISGVYKYPSGRRYILLAPTGVNNYKMAELTTSGLRICPTLLPQFCQLDAYGNCTTVSRSGNIYNFKKQIITFNGSNDPVLGTATNITSSVNVGAYGPLPSTQNFFVTTSKRFVTFDQNNTLPTGTFNRYHLAAYDSTTATPIFRTNVSTQRWYGGDVLFDGTYDVGNNVNQPCGQMAIMGNSIYVPRKDEGWKSSENGLFYKWNDLGMLQGIFGVIGKTVQGQTAAYAYATNTQGIVVTSVGGNHNLFGNDESQHGGAHWWQIGNLSSEGITSTTFQLVSRAFSSPSYSSDILHNVPNGQISIKGTPGWVQSQNDNINPTSTSAPNQFYSVTRKNIFYPNLSADVQFYATSGITNGYWTRTITTNPQWTITGQFDLSVNTFIGFEPNSGDSDYIEIEDAAGKSIIRVYFYNDNKLKINGTLFGPYPQPKYGASAFTMQRVQGTNNVRMYLKLWGSSVPVIYTGTMQDTTADVVHPTYFKVAVQNLFVGFHLGLNSLFIY